MNILRFITAGSVDDGKSTLIGRLLYDSDAVLEDQLIAIKNANRKNEDGTIDLAILTDGLKAEREQGITIDVAYKYFNTDKRKFIIIDAPGHIQYTRNMFTGASNADVAIVLIDARKGVIEQTKRHTFICALLGIKHLVVCVNKMDLVNYDEQVFANIVLAYKAFFEKLNIATELDFIPISALNGDNIVVNSAKMPWYTGPNLLAFLEQVNVDDDIKEAMGRFNVQYIIRPQTELLHDYRGYAGNVLSGVIKKNQEVVIYPSGLKSSIAKIETFGTEHDEAFAPMSVTLHLKDNIDVSRGDVLVPQDQTLFNVNEFVATLCWMDSKGLEVGTKYLLQHHSRRERALIKEVFFKTDVNTLDQITEVSNIGLNEIVQVLIKTAQPIPFDAYRDNKRNGSFILIDERTNLTIAAGMFLRPSND